MKKIFILLTFLFSFNVASACDIPLNLSKNNFKGNESIVQKIQLILASDYDLYHPGLTTGYFGSLTEKAIKNLQSRYGLNQTGIIDNSTQPLLCQMLEKNICPIIGYNYSVGSSDAKNKNNDIILIQQLISNNSEYHTGYFGNITKNLLQNFQAQFGLNQTGVFDFDTYQFVCSILTNTSTATVTTQPKSSNSVPNFSNTNIVKYLKSELEGKTLNILLDISNLKDNEEIYILFNQDKKGVYKTGNTLEIIYNLEENKIHSINQPKLSFFNKLKNYLFASFSMIEKLSNFLGAPIGFTPENGVVQVYDNGEIFRYLNNPLESSDTTNSDNIIVRPDKTEVLKTSDYYLPVELNISSPHLRYLEYGIGNSFVANTYDFSVPQNHKYAQTYYLEDFHDVDENPSGRPSSNVFWWKNNAWHFTEKGYTAEYSTLAINKYIKENPCTGIKQIPFYVMYLECPHISAQSFSDKIYEIKSTCCSDWYRFLNEDISKANLYSNPWYFDDNLAKDSILQTGADNRKDDAMCLKRSPLSNSSTAASDGYQYEGEYGKCVRHRAERWISTNYCTWKREIVPVNIDCKYTPITKEYITTTTKGILYHDKYIWKCDNLSKKCYITESGNYLSREQCEEYCQKDFLDNSNLYSFGSSSHYTKQVNLQILNQDGKVFEKVFHILQD